MLTLFFIIYFLIFLGTALVFSLKRKSVAYDRSLNFVVAAFSAHASDMSAWFFMGFPAAVFTGGLFEAWIAIGLVFFMFLNWRVIALRLRILTERFNSHSLSSYFEKRFNDETGFLRLFTVLVSIFLFAVYIAAGLLGLGQFFEYIFNLNYAAGILIASLLIFFYTLSGGFLTLAWSSLFQGLIVLMVLILTPLIAYFKIGGVMEVWKAAELKHISLSLFPPDKSFLNLILIAISWGIGYWGAPHILVNFMGIKDFKQIRKAEKVGIVWQIITLSLAIIIGLIGIAFFKFGLPMKELVFILMIKEVFRPWVAGFALAAIWGAIINNISSQASTTSAMFIEDFYKRYVDKNASFLITKIFMLLLIAISALIALYVNSTVYKLVEFCWFAFGAIFAPGIILSLYSKKTNKYGVGLGLITGFLSIMFLYIFKMGIPALIPSFLLNMTVIFVVSLLTNFRKY